MSPLSKNENMFPPGLSSTTAQAYSMVILNIDFKKYKRVFKLNWTYFMAKKLKYSIRPSKEIIAIKPILPFVDNPDDISLGDDSSFFDADNNQFLNDWIEPSSLSEEMALTDADIHVMAITGNLLASLASHLKPVEISHIDNIPIHFLEEIAGSSIAHIHKSQSNGELTVYCKETNSHKPGDFIYTLGTQEYNNNQEKNSEIFSYTLIYKNHKQITLQLTIQFTDDDLDIDLPDLGIIQEEDLMTGNLAKTRGLLPGIVNMRNSPKSEQRLKFLPIEQQYSLKAMHLTVQQEPLSYELSNHGTTLIGRQAKSKQTVLTAQIDPKGLYDFELHQPIDRPVQANLMSNNFKRTVSSLYQDVATKSGKIYEFSFYFKPIKDILPAQTLALSKPLSVEVWWAGLLIGVIYLMSETLKGYHFTLEGQEDNTRLELKLTDNSLLTTQHLASHLDMATLVPEEQTQIRFELGFEHQPGIQQQFPITLNLEHEVLVNQAAPYTITLDDLSPYKKIVLSENAVFGDNPATTLNLEKIFEHMQIPDSHRHVDIQQLEHSNIYEIKISDNTDKLAEPITVADIELKFDGGNAGLEALARYLSIDI